MFIKSISKSVNIETKCSHRTCMLHSLHPHWTKVYHNHNTPWTENIVLSHLEKELIKVCRIHWGLLDDSISYFNNWFINSLFAIHVHTRQLNWMIVLSACMPIGYVCLNSYSESIRPRANCFWIRKKNYHRCLHWKSAGHFQNINVPPWIINWSSLTWK